MLALDYMDAMNEDLAMGISMDKLLVDETLAGFAAYGPTGREEVVKAGPMLDSACRANL